jgi:hypothetical protein
MSVTMNDLVWSYLSVDVEKFIVFTPLIVYVNCHFQ